MAGKYPLGAFTTRPATSFEAELIIDVQCYKFMVSVFGFLCYDIVINPG
jgi:hypothetical protein